MKIYCTLLFLLPALLIAQQDTVSIYYEIDSCIPSTQELDKLKLDSSSKNISIISYTDYLGAEDYNQELSLNRSETIKNALLKQGIKPIQIKNISGKGKIGKTLNSKTGIAKNRRTDVIFDRLSVAKKSNLDSELEEVEVGSTMVLKKLSFIPGHHYLQKQSLPTLDSLLNTLENNPKLKIAIEGHVCCSPGETDGMDLKLGTRTLSIERAKHIYEYLIEHGISEERLSYKGLAKKNPLFPLERNSAEQQANRRVEIRVIEK